MTRARWLAIAKLAVAVAIVTILAASGKLSLASLGELARHPGHVVAILAVNVVILVMGVLRWWVLARAIDRVPRRYSAMLAYTWIGMFFGTVAPSSIATDVTRYHYLHSRSGTTGAAALTSIVLDRLVGVTGICVLALACAPDLARRLLDGSRALVVIAVACGLGAVVAVMYALRTRLRLTTQLDRLASALRSAARAPLATLAAFALSIGAHALKVVVLWLVVDAVSPGLPLATCFTFAPVGLLVEALPLAPGGLGTAHLAFEHLFALHAIAGGAALFNGYFVTKLVVTLAGGLIWLALPRDRDR